MLVDLPQVGDGEEVECLCTDTPAQIVELAQTLIKGSIGEYVGDMLTNSCVDIIYKKLADVQQKVNLRLSFCAEIDVNAAAEKGAAPT